MYICCVLKNVIFLYHIYSIIAILVGIKNIAVIFLMWYQMNSYGNDDYEKNTFCSKVVR